MRLLTRITVEGIDNIPSEGPVILAGNHAAYIEPVLMTMMPKRIVEPIGAGDIPFDGILDSLVGFYGFIPVNRGNLDRTALNRAISVLQQGGVIGIFPEGGTWEPGRMVPQPGAAMLSLRTGATVVPIGFSGLNGALKSALQLKRPKLLMRVGEPILALKANGSIPDKDQLMAFSRQVLDAVFDLISEEDKNLIPEQASYSLSVETTSEQLPDPSWGSAVARFLHLPVILETLRVNLKLPVKALYEKTGSVVNLDEVSAALSAISDYLEVNPAFFTYRFGMEVGRQVAVGVQELHSLLTRAKIAGEAVRMRTYEAVTYKDGRVETNSKHFLIEPSAQPGY